MSLACLIGEGSRLTAEHGTLLHTALPPYSYALSSTLD